MQYRQLGTTDLKVSSVILGTWALGGWMWGGLENNEPMDAIAASLDHGINTIDTAPAYGFGLSEELVGKAIKGRRGEVIIATKFGLRWDLEEGEFFFDTRTADGKPVKMYKNRRKKSIFEECDRSLRRLGVDEIDLYQCHWPDATTAEDDMMEALLTLQEKGKIRAFGVSNFTAEMMERCLQMAPLASLQPPYSLLVRDIEENIVPFCQGHSIGIICYSPMFRGLLTGKFSEDHEFSEGDTRAKNPWYRGERLKSVNRVLREVVKPIADHHGVQTAQIAVAWCLARPGITAALVGARNRQQALANVQAGNVNLSTEDVTRITAAFDELLGKYA